MPWHRKLTDNGLGCQPWSLLGPLRVWSRASECPERVSAQRRFPPNAVGGREA
jgi:hypothetical protein